MCKRHSINSILLVSLLLLFGAAAIAPLNVAHAQSGSEITVASQNSNGATITGYYIILYSSTGNTLGSGFTPASFATSAGSTYSVQADSYGSCNFSNWSNGQTANPISITATSGTVALVAVYSCGTSTTSQVKITSQTTSGSTISGYYTILYDASGNVVSTGFTPATFQTNSGVSYSVKVDNYGSCLFNNWADGAAANPRTFTASSSTTSFTAVYYCGGSSGGGGSGTSQLTVKSISTSGSSLAGYYTVLFDSSGNVVSSGSTPATFTLNNGERYSVEVQSYGSYYFQYWQGTGSVTAPTPITINSATTLTAVMCNGPPGTCPNPTPVNGITVYANRIPASYWAPCFAVACSAGTGPGASMYFALEDLSGNVLQSAFANEQGYTFTGLTAGTTYYVYASNCDLCHGSTHDVVFQYWAQGNSTADPIAATVGTSLDAWYSCTNGCGGT